MTSESGKFGNRRRLFLESGHSRFPPETNDEQEPPTKRMTTIKVRDFLPLNWTGKTGWWALFPDLDGEGRRLAHLRRQLSMLSLALRCVVAEDGRSSPWITLQVSRRRRVTRPETHLCCFDGCLSALRRYRPLVTACMVAFSVQIFGPDRFAVTPDWWQSHRIGSRFACSKSVQIFFSFSF